MPCPAPLVAADAVARDLLRAPLSLLKKKHKYFGTASK